MENQTGKGKMRRRMTVKKDKGHKVMYLSIFFMSLCAFKMYSYLLFLLFCHECLILLYVISWIST